MNKQRIKFNYKILKETSIQLYRSLFYFFRLELLHIGLKAIKW